MDQTYSKQYLNELKEIPLLEGERLQQQLGRLPDQSAKEAVIYGNLAYVAKLAQEYESEQADVLDLLQEGSMALTLLVNHYKEGDFIAMRERALRTAMQSYCDAQKQNGDLEEKVTATINVMNRVTTVLAKELGREATVEEVAAKMKMSEDEIRILMKEAFNAVSTNNNEE